MNFALANASSLLIALALSIVVFMLTAYRMKLIYSAFNLFISYHQALAAQSATVLGNMFWVPIIGGIIGQKRVLHNIPPAALATIHLCERVFVAGIGALLAVICFWFIFGGSWLTQEHLIADLVHISLAMLIIGSYVFHQSIMALLGGTPLLRVGIIALLTVLIWCLGSCFFVCFLYPDYLFTQAFTHSSIVSFLSSLPITWNGWGVREAASVFIFGNMGVSTSQAISIGIVCGVLSMLVALAMGLKWACPKLDWQVREMENNIQLSEDLFLKALGLACAFLIFFQIHIQGELFKININAADPLALCGLFLYGLGLWKNRLEPISWGPIFFMLATCLTLILSSFVGMNQFGGSWWGVLNKGVGLWVVWGYFGLGVVLAKQQDALPSILGVMKKVLVCIVIYHFVSLAVSHNFYSGNFLCSDLKGFSMNRNAFALQAVCLLLLLACCSKSCKSLVLINVALYFTFSRTAYVLTPLVYLLLWWFGAIDRRHLTRIWSLSVVWVVAINMFQPLFYVIAKNLGFMAYTSLFPSNYSSTYSDNERWYTIIQGFNMWKDHPWFGAGLGAFVQNEQVLKQRYLMIHNSYIWILAEMGLLGAVVWGSFAGWLGLASWHLKDKYRFAAVGIFSIMLISAMVHEVIYQRIFWWTLGLLLGAQPESLALPRRLTFWVRHTIMKAA